MKLLLVFTLLLGPIIPLAPRSQTEEAEGRRACCCRCGCGSADCPCGCRRPIKRSNTDDEPMPAGAAFCDCGDMPLALPPTPVEAPTVVSLIWDTPASSLFNHAEASCRLRLCGWPNGPPPDIPLMAAVILLN